MGSPDVALSYGVPECGNYNPQTQKLLMNFSREFLPVSVKLR